MTHAADQALRTALAVGATAAVRNVRSGQGGGTGSIDAGSKRQSLLRVAKRG